MRQRILKNIGKNILIVVLVFVTVFGTGFGWGYATEEQAKIKESLTSPPTIYGESAVLIDAKTGTVLYDKKMHIQREPASTTKIMTGILALENLGLDDVIIIDEEVVKTGGSSVNLKVGEELTVRELLYAMFLASANDSAAAIAKGVGGTLSEFAIMMNDKAIELGAENTHFINPHGLHEEGHLTTAYDLAMIAKYAMENETFREYVKTVEHVIPMTNKSEERTITTTNILLNDTTTKINVKGVLRPAKYEGITGIKTGNTPEAGGCLIASAERDGTELIAVVLTSTYIDRFGDCAALLDWGFSNYYTVNTATKDQVMGEVEIKRGAEKTVNFAAKENGYCTMLLGKRFEDLTQVVKVNEDLRAPIKKGDSLGFADFFDGESLVSSVEIVAAEDVEKGGVMSLFGITKKDYWKVYIVLSIVLVLLVIAFIGVLVARYKNKQKAKKRRAELAMKIAMEREMQRVYENKKRYM